MTTCNSRLHDAQCDLPAGHDEHRGRGKKWRNTHLVGISRKETAQLREALQAASKLTCNYICTVRSPEGHVTFHHSDCRKITDAIKLLEELP